MVLGRKGCYWRTEYDCLGELRRAARVVFGAFDQKLKNAGAIERDGGDAECLFCVALVEGAQRDKPVVTGIAKQGVDKDLNLIAIGFEDHAAISSSNAFRKSSSNAAITRAENASRVALSVNSSTGA